MPKNSSVASQFFEKSADRVQRRCKLCKKFIKHCGNTTNLLSHLKRKHSHQLSFDNKSEYGEVEGEDEEQEELFSIILEEPDIIGEGDPNSKLQYEVITDSENISDEKVRGDPLDLEPKMRKVTVTRAVNPFKNTGKPGAPIKYEKGKRVSSSSLDTIPAKRGRLSYGTVKQEQANEFDAFCNSLAIQLKKMPLRNALICQEKLQMIMTQHRLSALPSENQTTPMMTQSLSNLPLENETAPINENENDTGLQDESGLLAEAISSIGGCNS